MLLPSEMKLQAAYIHPFNREGLGPGAIEMTFGIGQNTRCVPFSLALMPLSSRSATAK